MLYRLQRRGRIGYLAGREVIVYEPNVAFLRAGLRAVCFPPALAAAGSGSSSDTWQLLSDGTCRTPESAIGLSINIVFAAHSKGSTCQPRASML